MNVSLRIYTLLRISLTPNPWRRSVLKGNRLLSSLQALQLKCQLSLYPRFRGLSVQNMTYGWDLETTIFIREIGHGCHDWLMKHAVDIALTPEQLDNIAIGKCFVANCAGTGA